MKWPVRRTIIKYAVKENTGKSTPIENYDWAKLTWLAH